MSGVVSSAFTQMGAVGLNRLAAFVSKPAPPTDSNPTDSVSLAGVQTPAVVHVKTAGPSPRTVLATSLAVGLLVAASIIGHSVTHPSLPAPPLPPTAHVAAPASVEAHARQAELAALVEAPPIAPVLQPPSPPPQAAQRAPRPTPPRPEPQPVPVVIIAEQPAAVEEAQAAAEPAEIAAEAAGAAQPGKNVLNHVGSVSHTVSDRSVSAGKKIGRGFKKFGGLFGKAGREIKEGWDNKQQPQPPRPPEQ